jgi:hypothetical protein
MDPDALDNQHAIVGLDLADRLYLVALRIDLDLTRLQRAGERARQSPPGGSHHVIECRGVRRILLRTHPVVLGHLGMHAEHNWLRLGREVRQPLGPAEPFNPDPRYVRDPSHGALKDNPIAAGGFHCGERRACWCHQAAKERR